MIDAMISVKPQYVDKMLTGAKTAELRTRKINLPKGSRIWIYSTLPEGAVKAVGIISDVISGPTSEIWSKYSNQIAISKKEFDEYCKDHSEVSVVLFSSLKTLKRNNSLKEIRSIKKEFQPPQFFMKLSLNDPVNEYLVSQM